MQKIGAFKARGAHHAIGRLIEEKGLEEVRKRGVATHSSGKLQGVRIRKHQGLDVSQGHLVVIALQAKQEQPALDTNQNERHPSPRILRVFGTTN